MYFDEAFPLREGLGRIESAGKWGYVDKQIRMVIEPQFTMAGDFREGFAPVEINRKWGYINSSGDLVTALFDGNWPFCEGIARVNMGAKKTQKT